MRHLRALLVAVAVCACSAAPTQVRPVAGAAYPYVQTFRLTERMSGGEQLPDVRIERAVTLECTRTDADAATLAIRYGDVSVWLDEDDALADFVAADSGAAMRAFDNEDSTLAAMYASLWAATAHLEAQATIDAHGEILELIGGIDEVRRERGDDPSGDLGGAFLESVVDDASLLLFGRARSDVQRLSFRLGEWRSSFNVEASVEHPDGSSFELTYESRSGAGRDGPFADLSVTISGGGARDPASGMLETATLRMEVAADVPVGAKGATRRDAAVLEYELVRAR